MELKEQVDCLQKDIAQLTVLMQEKAQKDQLNDFAALAEKVAGVQKELQEKKIQFADASTPASKLSEKELATRMDELFIAKHLCTNVETKAFDQVAYNKIASQSVYAEAIKAFGDVSAVDTATSTTGAEFIPKAFSTQLQEEIFLALEVASLFGRIPMPASDYTLPFSPGRIIVRAGGEGLTVTKDKPKTGKLSFTAKKIMSIVEMTDEFEQDSLVPALNFLRGTLIGGFALGQETMCMNGDTGTNIYSVALTGEDCRKLVKGFRADAMGTGAKLDAATGGISIDNLRAMRALMGKYGKTPSDLAHIVSMADYFKMLKLDGGYQSLYAYGANAIILKGELGRFDNIPIIVSELLPIPGAATDASDALGGLNASGLWDDTTKTKGTAAIVNKNAYMWGDRKEFSLELWRNPLNGTTNLIGSQRLDFEKVLAAADKTSAVMYNY